MLNIIDFFQKFNCDFRFCNIPDLMRLMWIDLFRFLNVKKTYTTLHFSIFLACSSDVGENQLIKRVSVTHSFGVFPKLWYFFRVRKDKDLTPR